MTPSSTNQIWGFAGAIVAAIITGYCVLVAAGKVRAPWEAEEHSRQTSSDVAFASQHSSPSPPVSTNSPSFSAAPLQTPPTNDDLPSVDPVPHVDIKELIPFQRRGGAPLERQKAMSQRYDGKRVTVAGYLVSKYERDPLVNFSIAPDPKTGDVFYMQMSRSGANRLLRTPLGEYLQFEATLAVPLRGAAVGHDAKILDSAAK